MFEIVQGYLEEFTYAGIFLILLLCGAGLPIPEDILLLTSGYLAHLEVIAFWPALAVNLAGILIGDATVYSIGRGLGGRAVRLPGLRFLLRERRRVRVEDFFRRHGRKAIFFGRFLAGIRAPVFLMAGIMRMPFRTFFLMDASAALITAPLLLSAAYFFGEEIDTVRAMLERTHSLLLAGAAGVAAWTGLRFFLHRRRKARPEAADG